METPATEEQIRTLAYHLWEEAGSPEGSADEFWLRARDQLATEPGIKSASAELAAENKPPAP